MAIEITPFPAELEPAVKSFNQRLKAGGANYRFPEAAQSRWLPKLEGRPIWQEYFLAVENGKEVRGAYSLKHLQFAVQGKIVSVGFYHLPISEQLVNKAYGQVGLQLLLHALRRQPRLFCLGIGSMDEPLAQLLQKLGWQFMTVPFYFKVIRPQAFLRNVAYLRKTAAKRAAADALALTGLGHLAIKLGHAALRKAAPRTAPVSVGRVEIFGSRSDALWQSCLGEYSFCGVRDSATLNLLYPRSKLDYLRLKFSQRDKLIGWALLLNTPMEASRHWGNLRLGSIVDLLAPKEHARAVIQAATRFLSEQGAELIVSNQADAAWGRALKDEGYLSGPSNFFFAASKKLAELLPPLDAARSTLHLNRGDGDGPINL